MSKEQIQGLLEAVAIGLVVGATLKSLWLLMQ